MTRRMLVGRVLRDTRVAQGLTQEDVALRLGRPQSYVSKVEAGDRRVDLVALVELCAALEVRPVDVVARVAVALAAAGEADDARRASRARKR